MHRDIWRHEGLHTFEGQDGILGAVYVDAVTKSSECENLSVHALGFFLSFFITEDWSVWTDLDAQQL